MSVFEYEPLESIEEGSRSIFEEFEFETKEANTRAQTNAEELLDEWRILNWPVSDTSANSLESNISKLQEMKERTIDVQNIGLISGNYITPVRQNNPEFMTSLVSSLKRTDYDRIVLQFNTDNPGADSEIVIPHNIRVFLHEVFTHMEYEFKLYEEEVNNLRRYERMYSTKGLRHIPMNEISKIYQMGGVLDRIENNNMTPDILKSEAFIDFCHFMTRGDMNALRANVKACNLIKDWLDKDEWDYLARKHEVVIKSKIYRNRFYVIKENAQDRVSVIEYGKEVSTLCGIVTEHDIKTRKQLVNGDQLLTKIITLKTDEANYLRNSNVFNGSGYAYNLGRFRLGLR